MLYTLHTVCMIIHCVALHTMCGITQGVKLLHSQVSNFTCQKGEEEITQASLVVLVTNMRCVIDWFPICYKDT